MGFKELAALDADVTISIGKRDKKTGKMGPKSAEGYYLGNRTVDTPLGKSSLHFLQTETGNVGVWGTTDLNRKLGQVPAGTMVRITSTGEKPTPRGIPMRTFKVELDNDNTIEVGSLAEAYQAPEAQEEGGYEAAEESYDDSYENTEAEEAPVAAVAASSAAARKAKVEAILKGKSK